MKTFEDYGIHINGTEHGEERTICPQCSAARKKINDKCLSINITEEVWICHHCGWSGGLKNGNDSRTICKAIPVVPKAIKLPDFKYTSDLPKDVLRFLVDERCIPELVLKRNKVCSKDGVIQFPYLKDGECVNIKSRTMDKKFWQSGAAEKVLYGYDDIEKDCLIWVEGEMDKLAIEVAGFKSCVSVPDGAPPLDSKNYTTKFEYLKTCENKLLTVENHVLAVDADGPGETLQGELVRRLGVEKCKLIEWPAGCKDANDVLIKHGEKALKECIEKAKPYPVKGLFFVEDVFERVLHVYDHGLVGGTKIGLSSLDELYSVKPGEWTLVTGIPSHGKSELIDAMIIALAEIHEWKVGICSPENQPLERHIAKLLEKKVGKPFREGPVGKMSSQDLMTGGSWMNKHFFFILPDENNLTVDEVLALARVLVFREGIKGLVIDPWNELDHNRPMGITETEYISQALTKIRRFARENDVHIWVVAHPTKLQKGTDGNYPVPSPYDVAGSAHWRNKADNCLSIWRDLSNPEDREVQVHVQKIRFKENGKVGTATLFYEFLTGKYRDCSF
ncbi:MAG: toprim domain-containing protein [Nitrospina sp.]|nr:toprim domain-containing protein [Nitrospina sp.]